MEKKLSIIKLSGAWIRTEVLQYYGTGQTTYHLATTYSFQNRLEEKNCNSQTTASNKFKVSRA